MTQRKHLKQLVRARMSKTGEKYGAARRQVVARAATAAARRPTRRAEPKRAGVGDTALRRRTGRGWEEWFAVLDAAGAAQRDHRGIVALLDERRVDGWWCQMIAVGYEQARGRRAVHQSCDGTFSASASKTLGVPVERLWAAWNGRERDRWLQADQPFTVRRPKPPGPGPHRPASPAASLRLAWGDGTTVVVYLYAKAAAKSQVAVDHQKLGAAAAVAPCKAFWKGALTRLAQAVAD